MFMPMLWATEGHQHTGLSSGNEKCCVRSRDVTTKMVHAQISPRTVVLQGGISARTALELPAFSVTIIATSPGKGDVALPSATGAAAAAAA